MRTKHATLYSPFLGSRRNYVVTEGDPHYKFDHITMQDYNDIIPGLKLSFSCHGGNIHFRIKTDHYVDCKTLESLMWGIIALKWPANYTFSGYSAADPEKCTTMEVHWGDSAMADSGYTYCSFRSNTYREPSDNVDESMESGTLKTYPTEYYTMTELRRLVKGGPVIGTYDNGFRGYNKAEVRFQFSEPIDETKLPNYVPDTDNTDNPEGLMEKSSASGINIKAIIIIAAIAVAAFLILKK